MWPLKIKTLYCQSYFKMSTKQKRESKMLNDKLCYVLILNLNCWSLEGGKRSSLQVPLIVVYVRNLWLFVQSFHMFVCTHRERYLISYRNGKKSSFRNLSLYSIVFVKKLWTWTHKGNLGIWFIVVEQYCVITKNWKVNDING